MIKNIIFDIGMVLVDFRWKGVMEDLHFPEEVIEYLDVNFINSKNWNELDRGVMKTEDIIANVKAVNPAYGEYVDRFFVHLADTIVSYDYSAPMMKSLKERGFKLYLLTNYPDELFKVSEREKFTFMPYVDGKIVSSRVHFIKPDPEIYKVLLNEYDLKPEECIFMDDRKGNIDAANALGIHGFVFKSYEDAVEQIERIIEANK